MFARITAVKNSATARLKALAITREQNKAQLIRGTVLEPNTHPSYSAEKVAAIVKADAAFSKTVKGAQTRRDNAIAAA